MKQGQIHVFSAHITDLSEYSNTNYRKIEEVN